jgi:hypothetical protein
MGSTASRALGRRGDDNVVGLGRMIASEKRGGA